MSPRFSRRDFLQTGAGAAGALLAGGANILDPHPLLAQVASTAPSDRVRFARIGVGMQGMPLLDNALQLPGVECVAAADLYDGRHTLAKELAGPNIMVTRRYQEKQRKPAKTVNKPELSFKL